MIHFVLHVGSTAMGKEGKGIPKMEGLSSTRQLILGFKQIKEKNYRKKCQIAISDSRK
jgi:hypothetical protein